jgi:hypothetical protein
MRATGAVLEGIGMVGAGNLLCPPGPGGETLFAGPGR